MTSSYVEVDLVGALAKKLGLSLRNYKAKTPRYVVVVVVPERARKRESTLPLVNWMVFVTLAMSRAMQAESR